jgi:hypothetical protein
LQKNMGQTTNRNRARLPSLFSMKFTQLPSQYSNCSVICIHNLVWLGAMKSHKICMHIQVWLEAMYHGWLACMINLEGVHHMKHYHQSSTEWDLVSDWHFYI